VVPKSPDSVSVIAPSLLSRDATAISTSDDSCPSGALRRTTVTTAARLTARDGMPSLSLPVTPPAAQNAACVTTTALRALAYDDSAAACTFSLLASTTAEPSSASTAAGVLDDDTPGSTAYAYEALEGDEP
jgi:hypothetical protein